MDFPGKESLVLEQTIAGIANDQATDDRSKNVTRLTEALTGKDCVIAQLKAQLTHIEEDLLIQRGLQEEFKSKEAELLQALQYSEEKVTAVEELRRKDLEAWKNQEMQWKSDREEVLRDLDRAQDALNCKTEELQMLGQKLLRADDAVAQLTQSKLAMVAEVNDLKAVVEEMDLKLKEAESARSLGEAKEDEIASLQGLLQTRDRAIQNVRKELAENQRTMNTMAAELTAFQETQQRYTALLQESQRKDEQLQALVMSQEKFKIQVKALEDTHLKVVEEMELKLKEAELAQSLGKAKEDEIASLQGLLQTRDQALQTVLQELAENQRTMNTMAAEFTAFQETQQRYAALLEESQRKDEQLQALAMSQEKSKFQVKALEDTHLKVVEEMDMKLREAESAVLSLGKAKEDEITSLQGLLQTRDQALQTIRQELAENQRTMSTMADELTTLQETQQRYARLIQEFQRKEEQLRALGLSHENFKLQVKALEDSHLKERNELIGNLEKALESRSEGETRLVELECQVERLQVALNKAQIVRNELESEATSLKEKIAVVLDEKLSLRQELDSQVECNQQMEALKSFLASKEEEAEGLKHAVESLQQSLCNAKEEEEQWLCRQAQWETLSQQLKAVTLGHNELLSLHQNTLLQYSEKEELWLREKEELASEVQRAGERLAEAERKLQTAFSDAERMRTKCFELENQVKLSKTEIGALHLKLGETCEQLEMSNRDLLNMQLQLQVKSSALEGISDEKNTIIQGLKRAVHEQELQVQELAQKNQASILHIESLEKEAQNYQHIKESLERKIAKLEEMLSEKSREIITAAEIRDALEAKLTGTEEELEQVKRGFETQTQLIRESASTSELKLQQALMDIQQRDGEIRELMADLDCRDDSLSDLNAQKQILLQEKEVLLESVKVLQAKCESLLLEIEEGNSRTQQLCSLMEEREASLDLSSKELKRLHEIIESSEQSRQNNLEREERLKELEDTLAEASASLHDKEEKLCASEWAVQQLAHEVAKAKNSLAAKEREEILLRNRLSDMETRLKAKEREFADMESHVQNTQKKVTHKQSEIDKLNQALQKMESREAIWASERQGLESERQHMGSLLDEKISEVALSHAELQKGLERQQLMENSIQNLNSKLAEQAQALKEQKTEFEMLVEELEASHSKEASASAQLKEAESKLQNLEQVLQDQIQKLQTRLSDEQDQVKSSSSQLLELELELQTAEEKLVVQTERCCSLTAALAAKESSVESLQRKLDHIQTDLSYQLRQISQKDTELEHAREEILGQNEKARDLHEKIHQLEAQLLDRENDCKQLKEEKTMTLLQVDEINNEKTMQCEMIRQLESKLEHLEGILAEKGELHNKLIQLTQELDISLRMVKEKEAMISDLEEALESTKLDCLQLKDAVMSNEKTLQKVHARLRTAEDEGIHLKCRMNSLERDIEKTQKQLESESEKAKGLARANGFLKTEVEEKLKVNETLKAQLEGAEQMRDKVITELSALSAKEKDVQDKLGVLIEALRERVYSCSTDGHIQVGDQHGNLHVLEMLVEHLKIEEKKRRDSEADLVEQTKGLQVELNEREKQIKDLTIEIRILREREGECAEWVGQLIGAIRGLGEEVGLIAHSNQESALLMFCTSSWKDDCAQLCTEVEAAKDEIMQLKECWEAARERSEEQAQEQILPLRALLAESQSQLQKEQAKLQESNSLLETLKVELNTFKDAAEAANDTSRIEIKRLSQLNEQLRGQLKKEKEAFHLQLAEWKGKEEGASKDVQTLRLNVAELEMVVTRDLEQITSLETEVEAWRARAQIASSLSSELAEAVETIRSLGDEVKQKDLNLGCLQSQVDDWKLKAERTSENVRELKVTVEEASKKIEQLSGQIEALEAENSSLQYALSEMKERADAAWQEKIVLESELRAVSESMVAEKEDLQVELEKWRQKASELASSSDAALSELKERLEATERDKQRLQDTCQKLEVNLEHAQTECRERKRLTGSLLAKIKMNTEHNKANIEERLQGLYRRMTMTDGDTMDSVRSYAANEAMQEEESHHELKTVELIQDNHDAACMQGPHQEEMDRYLALCDSVVRRHARLKEQLESLTRSASGGERQPSAPSLSPCSSPSLSPPSSMAGRKKRSSRQEEGEDGNRKPLQPLMVQAATTTKLSPLPKRRRSVGKEGSENSPSLHNAL